MVGTSCSDQPHPDTALYYLGGRFDYNEILMKEVVTSLGRDNFSGFGLLSLTYASFIHSICRLTEHIIHHTSYIASYTTLLLTKNSLSSKEAGNGCPWD